MFANIRTATLAALLALLPVSAFAEGVDLGIESEAAFVDSESAIAEAEDSRRRALEEREQLRQAKRIAAREAARARIKEDHAKKKITKWMEEEKGLHGERVVAEKRTEKAREDMRKTQAKLDAKEAELKALKEIVEAQVAERDRMEALVEKSKERIALIEQRQREEMKRKAAAEAETVVSREKIKMNRDRIRELARRSPSSRPVGQVRPAAASTTVAQ